MSYSGVHSYPPYYGQDCSAQDAYPRTEDQSTSAPLHPGADGNAIGGRLSQYGSNPYNWDSQQQTQNGYGSVNGDISQRASSGWRGMNDHHQPTGDHQSSAPSHQNAASHNATTTPYQNDTSQPAASHSTHALSNLAYASGLESAGLQSGSTQGGQFTKSSQNAYRQSQNSGYTTSSGSLPASFLTQNYQGQHSTQPYVSQRPQSQSAPQSELAMSAAAALAGAVSRRHAGQRSPATNYQQPQAAASATGNAASKQAHPTQPVNRVASPYNNVGQVSNRPTEPYRMQSATGLGSPNIPRPASTSKQTSNARQTGQATQSLPNARNSSAQNDSSIANLVTNTSPQQAAAMPNFVDPTQVFNPYHKEYERQKREAAEAEARRQASNQPGSQNEPTSSWSQVVIPGESAAPNGEASTAKTSQGTKRKRRSDASQVSNSAPPKRPLEQETSSEEDAEMAKEMKAMIEKMRSWKNKDPSMFQKLWEEMKKGGPGQPAPASAGSTSTPLPQVRQASLPKTREPKAPSKEAADNPNPVKAPFTLPPGVPMHPNGYTVVVENNPEGLPDLGRFPAERRYRGSYKKQLSIQGSSIPIDPTLITSGKPADPSPTTAPLSMPRPVQQSQAGSQPPRPPAQQSTSQQASQRPPPHAAQKSTAQGQTGKLANGGTLWPQEKRKSLAEAAVKALNANPANIDKKTTVQMIHDLLEQNPSYIDLCTMLEHRGLVLHRSQFARSLLSNVPDLASPQQRTELGPKPHSANPLASFVKPAVGTPAPKWQSFMNDGDTKAEVNFSQQSARFNTPSRLDGTTQSKPGNARLHVPAPQAPTPKPGSKEAMARKRDFAELVDLSQLSDDEDYVMPSKKPRTEEAEPKREVFQTIDNEGFLPHLTAPSNSNTIPSPSQAFVPSNTQPLQFNPNQSQPLIAPAPPAKPKTTLATKINKNEALRKSYYDPKTIARDILIAAGRHPTERPLNAHMAGLLNKHIDIDSDLATFDWDAVDPGGPPMPRVQMVDIPAGPPRWKLGVRRKLGEDEQFEPIRIAQFVPAKRGPASQTALNSTSRLSAPATSLSQEGQKPVNSQPQPQSRLRQYEVADEAVQNDVNTSETQPKRNSTPAQASTPVASSRTRTTASPAQQRGKSAESDKNMDDSGSFWPSGKRRGRPPGAKNKHPSIATMKNAAYTGSHASMPSANEPVRYETYDCHWRKCGAKLHNLPTLRKHISKMHQEAPEKASRNGHVCWWKKCTTLTRNEDKTVTPNTSFPTFETWMNHIDEAHLHPLGMEIGDGPSTSHIGKPKSLNLTQYMYQSRQDPARTGSYIDPQQIAADRAKYLADGQGRLVTFLATDDTNEEYAADALVIVPRSDKEEESDAHKKEELDARKDFMRAHGNAKLDIKKSAEETLRAMEARKEKIGPGMDRGGCTLVNQERRTTLIQDQGLAGIMGD